MAKLKKRVHKDTMKIAGMVAKKNGSTKPNAVAEKTVKKHKIVRQKSAPQKPVATSAQQQQRKADHFRPPGADEWRALQEGDVHSNYNFFKLQADEFLGAIHRKQERVKVVVDKWLTHFNAFLHGLPAGKDKIELDQKMPWLKDIAVPFDLSKKGLKGCFKFVAPKEKAFLVGSQTIATTAPFNNAVSVDVVVVMPKEFFQTADYLNYTYHYKKALYMSYIVSSAQKAKQIDVSSAQFSFLEDNSMLPVLIIPLSDDTSKVQINIQVHFCAEAGVYKLNRFIPERNNIRAVTISNKFNEDQQASLNAVPTFHYNNSILRDLLVAENQKLIDTLIGKFSSVSDALILIKYWLRRRKLHSVLSSYALSMLMCHLIKTKKVNPTAMTYYQIIRIFFSHFHLTDMTKAMSLHDNVAAEEMAPALSEMSLYSELCFVDTTGFYNIFSRLTLNDMKRLVLESGKSLQMMDKSHTNTFQWLFLSDVPETVVFDHIFHLEVSQKVESKIPNLPIDRLERMSYFGMDTHTYLCDLINQFLSRGLDTRVHLLQLVKSPMRTWRANQSPPAKKNSLLFGLILNPENAFEVIIKGPQANDPSAAEFREFWGELSQLRRFKDGAVTEACVFGSSGDNPTEKRLVTQRIVEHLLGEHLKFLNAAKESLWRHSYYANQLSTSFDISAANKKYGITDTESQALQVLSAFNEVEMELRRLEGLPLDITGILGTSPIFYYSDPKKNLPNGFFAQGEAGQPSIIQGDAIYDAVLTLSVSGKWPENVEAMRRLKAAFYIEIGNRIKRVRGLFCSVAVDHVCIMKNSYAFRFRLAHSKELQLLRQSVDDGMVVYRDNAESLAMERDLFVKPTLASALHGLHQQHNAFGPTVCLVKSWINSQLLDNAQWAEECTELLVASLFMDDSRCVTAEAPIQPQTGFMRFLHLMANKNWQTECVLLNFNESLSAEKVEEIQSHFTMNRSQYPPVTIITSFDEKYTGFWGRDSPILQVLVRVIMLSKELLTRLTTMVAEKEPFCNKTVFLTKLKGYDAKIHLSEEKLQFLNRVVSKNSTRLPADFNPVEIYLKELRSAFGEVALFFYDSIAPTKIGVIWKPSVDVPRDFRISDVNTRYMVDNQLVFKKAAICRDFALIGKGLVDRVE